MDLALTKQWITHWESTRLQSYDDATGTPRNPGDTPRGNPTIGVGFNLVAAGAQANIESLGLNYNDVLTGAVSKIAIAGIGLSHVRLKPEIVVVVRIENITAPAGAPEIADKNS